MWLLAENTNANRRDKLRVGPRSAVFTKQRLIYTSKQLTALTYPDLNCRRTWKAWHNLTGNAQKDEPRKLRPQRWWMDRAEQQVQTAELGGVCLAFNILIWTHSVTATTHMQVPVFTWIKEAFQSIFSQDATSEYQSVTRLDQMYTLNK